MENAGSRSLVQRRTGVSPVFRVAGSTWRQAAGSAITLVGRDTPCAPQTGGACPTLRTAGRPHELSSPIALSRAATRVHQAAVTRSLQTGSQRRTGVSPVFRVAGSTCRQAAGWARALVGRDTPCAPGTGGTPILRYAQGACPHELSSAIASSLARASFFLAAGFFLNGFAFRAVDRH
jgi:hypothetical protein